MIFLSINALGGWTPLRVPDENCVAISEIRVYVPAMSRHVLAEDELSVLYRADSLEKFIQPSCRGYVTFREHYCELLKFHKIDVTFSDFFMSVRASNKIK